MRILILTQYYPPETGAPQNRLSDLAKRLTACGHTITVLTAMPNYPMGRIFEQYSGRLLLQEEMTGVRVIRTWVYTSPSKAFLNRIVNFVSFVLSSLILGFWKIGRQDVVVVESPPLFTGISGYIVSRVKRARLVFNVSDLWPGSAVAMGILKNRLFIRLSTRLEEFIYAKSDLITGQTQGIVDDIRLRFPGKKVRLITNGVDLTMFSGSNAETRQRLQAEFDLSGKFVVGYAGLHGLAQGLEIMIEAASIVAPCPDLVFALFGDGPEKHRLKELAVERGLSNIRFYQNQARERMPEILASFDVAVVPLRRLELFKGALPSKLFEAMASALPLVVSIEGEAFAMVTRAKAGICVEPENPSALAEAIMQIYRNRSLGSELGANGRDYVMRNYDRAQIAKTFETLLLELVKREESGKAA